MWTAIPEVLRIWLSLSPFHEPLNKYWITIGSPYSRQDLERANAEDKGPIAKIASMG